jgi:hypothetical protein
MRHRWLVCLLLGGLAYGQAANPAPPPTPQPAAGAKAVPAADASAKPAESKVNPTDPVITVKATCSDPAKEGEPCETVVTREQFEKMAESLQPGMSAAIRIRLANTYSQLVALSQAAENRSLDKTAKFEASMSLARMQILSQLLRSALQEESNQVSDPDIEKYYKDKIDGYQEATLQRLFVPHTKQIPTPKVTSAKPAVKKDEAAEKAEAEARMKAGEAAMKKAAVNLRARAAKGEDFDALQKEAYVLAGLKGNPPKTEMDKVRPNTLPSGHHAALDLNVGEVSQVISDPTGHFIYKLVSKQTLPLDAVKAEIKNAIATQRFRDAMQQAQGSANLNEAYFGPASAPKPPAPPAKPVSEPQPESVKPD